METFWLVGRADMAQVNDSMVCKFVPRKKPKKKPSLSGTVSTPTPSALTTPATTPSGSVINIASGLLLTVAGTSSTEAMHSNTDIPNDDQISINTKVSGDIKSTENLGTIKNSEHSTIIDIANLGSLIATGARLSDIAETSEKLSTSSLEHSSADKNTFVEIDAASTCTVPIVSIDDKA